MNPPLRTLPIAFLALIVATAPATRAEDPPLPSASELTRHLDDLYRSTSSHGTLRLEVVTKRYSRTLELEAWTRGEELALVVIRAPAREAGNASLKTTDGLWSYGKRSDRLLRIPPGLLGESWMGSHLTNDDLLRDSSYAQDYDVTLARVTEAGTPLWRLRLVPKPDTAIVYTALEYFVTPDTRLPTRLDFYDKAKIIRQMFFEAVKPLGGRALPTVMRIVPADAPGEHTIVTYVDMRFDVPVDAATFTPQGLRRATER